MILPNQKILPAASRRNLHAFSLAPSSNPAENPEGRLAVASNPSICVSIPLISNVMWPFQEIGCAGDRVGQFRQNRLFPRTGDNRVVK